MASRARVEQFRALNADLNRLARRDLERFWGTLDKTDLAVARESISRMMVALSATYGRAAAVVAAQFYDDLRAESVNASGSYRAVVADGVDPEAVDGTARWVVGAYVAGGDPFGRASGAMQRIISQSGRNTVALNSSRDPSRGGWARVPTGPTTCGFCLMLASRGPMDAYATEESARFASDGEHYHDNCDCVPTQVWDGDPLPDGYDPDALRAQYDAARKEVGGNPDDIAQLLDEDRPHVK